MRVPVSWLRELVPVDVPTEDLAVRLSLTGTAVDKIERVGGDVSGVVVARVDQVADVEESNKLCIAQVDAGDHGRFQVLAGAKNFKAGDLVPFAKPGAHVTVGDVGVRRMLDTYESQGMLCSAKELGIADDHSGILVLSGAPVGADVAQLLRLDDEVLELEIYPNRPDLMSMIGVAREVALLYDVPMQMPDFSAEEAGPDVASLTSVTIEDPGGCPRYLARVVEDATFGPSPALVQARLTACGYRPLGNLVDATNYVLLLTGQPLHAFDLDKLAEQRIVVRRARPGERLTTLDYADRDLDPSDLVIADARDAQALAGVMGGAASEVGPFTKRVLIESAHFNPSSISRTSRRLHMRTEASVRFERGSDPEAVDKAAALCAELMRRWAGGRAACDAVDAGSAPARRTLAFRRARADAIAGTPIPVSEQDAFLRGIGCTVESANGTATVTAPSWRPDLEREIDLIEEVIRLHGYENVPMTQPTGQRGMLTRAQRLTRRIRDVLIGAGLSEANLTSFLAGPELALVGASDALHVTNPMSSEQSMLRPSLVPGLLRAAKHNVAQGVRDVRLFEMGVVWGGWPTDAKLPDEDLRVGVVMTGHAGADEWHTPSRPMDAFDGKGLVELLMLELGIDGWTLGPNDLMPYHPGRAATVLVDGVEVGRFGEVRPSVRDEMDLTGGAALIELSVRPLLERARRTLTVRELARFPAITRDIAAVLEEAAAASDVERTVRESAGNLLESVAIFDVYRGDPVPAGKKSVALRMTLRAPDRTLTSAEADGARASTVEALRSQLGADIR